MTQHKTRENLEFSERTEHLASILALNLSEIPERMDISPASFYAYRSGKASVSSKAWRKLEKLEKEVGVVPNQSSAPSPTTPSGMPPTPDPWQILARQNEIQDAQTRILERMLSALERIEGIQVRQQDIQPGKQKRRA